MGEHYPSNGGEVQKDVLLAAVLARRLDSQSVYLADLAMTRDEAGRVRVIADALAPAMTERIIADAAAGGVALVVLTREALLKHEPKSDTPMTVVHLHPPQLTSTGMRIVVSVDGFRAGTALPLETIAFAFEPDGDGWRLDGEPQHLAS